MTHKDLPIIIKDILSARTPRAIEDNNSSYNHYTHAAVLMPLYRDNGEYKLLFTKRTNRVEHHKGQISFPGGAFDKEDRSFLETALREANEEIGLSKEDVEILGQLDDTLTIASRFIIHPFVGFIPYPYHFSLNSNEVERVIEVPLKLFFDHESVDKRAHFEFEGVLYQTPVYEYNGDIIWGATARIMENFVDIIGEKLDLP